MANNQELEKDFYFINKTAESMSFSHNEPSVTSESLRHVQEQVRKSRLRRQPSTPTSWMEKVNPKNNKRLRLAAQRAKNASTTRAIYTMSRSSSSSIDTGTTPQNDTSSADDEDSDHQLTCSHSAAFDIAHESMQEHRQQPFVSLEQVMLTKLPERSKSETQDSLVVSDLVRAFKLEQKASAIDAPKDAPVSMTATPDHSSAVTIGSAIGCLNRISTADPFCSISMSFNEVVQICLQHLETLWKTRSTSQKQALGCQAVLECMSDRLQLACLVAAVTSRLENLYGIAFPGTSIAYTQVAIRELQKRLNQGLDFKSKDIWAIMNLYVAEAYRNNFSAAMLHLNGAVAASARIGTQLLDCNSTSTICGAVEECFLPHILFEPVIFKTVADPGPAKKMAWYDAFWGRKESDRDDRLASTLILSYRRRELDTTQKVIRIGILQDILEYTRVRRRTVQLEQASRPVPEIITRWAYLRRINLVLRLLSGKITPNDLISHCVRICLIAWLNIIADVSALSRGLETLATHLRDVIQQLPGYEITNHSMLMIWMFFIGAVTGSKEGDAHWFIQCLTEFLAKSKAVPKVKPKELFDFLEGLNEGFFYCRELQRKSVEELATQVYLVFSTMAVPSAEA